MTVSKFGPRVAEFGLPRTEDSETPDEARARLLKLYSSGDYDPASHKDYLETCFSKLKKLKSLVDDLTGVKPDDHVKALYEAGEVKKDPALLARLCRKLAVDCYKLD